LGENVPVFKVVISATYEVKAEDEEDAREIALDLLKEEMRSGALSLEDVFQIESEKIYDLEEDKEER